MRRDQAGETGTRDRPQAPAPAASTRLRGELGGPVVVSIAVLRGHRCWRRSETCV